MRKADDFVAIECLGEYVHAGDDIEVGESVSARSPSLRGRRGSRRSPAPCPEDSVGHDSHQPDPAAAVNKVNLASHERFAHLASRFPVRGRGTRR